MQTIRGYLMLIRPLNSLVMGFAIVVGVFLAGYGNLNWLSLFLGIVTSFTLTAASMAVNDYYDYNIDKINEPQRPIPSGAVSKIGALAVTAGLTVIGLACAYFVSFYCLIFALGAWIIMMTYSTLGKRSGLPG